MPTTPSSHPPLIVADIGATNARFGILKDPAGPISYLRRFGDERFPTFEDVVGAYLNETGDAPKDIAIGAAGPLKAGAITLTNRDWIIDPVRLEQRFDLRTRVLANDLVALAAGIAVSDKGALLDLTGASPNPAKRTLVIAIGTGLGSAWFERENDRIRLHPSEAGHMRMGPADAFEADLLATLIRKAGPLSFENVASGSGIPLIYAALRSHADADLPTTQAILDAAEAGSNGAAKRTIAFALGALCSFARDFMLALGGVDEIVFAGGLGLRLRSHLSAPGFLQSLRDSSGIPLDFSQLRVRLTQDDTLALRGIANLAFGLIDCREIYKG